MNRLVLCALLGVILLSTTFVNSSRVLGAVIFHDDFTVFTLGPTTWKAWGGEAVPNVILNTTTDGDKSVLHVQSHGVVNDGFAFEPATPISIPYSQYGDLSMRVVFKPIAGNNEPLEIGFSGDNGGMRVFTRSYRWSSDGTDLPNTTDGTYVLGRYYDAVVQVTSTGTEISVFENANPAAIVYSRNWSGLTRGDFSDHAYFYFRQVIDFENNDQITFIDSVTINANVIPEPTSIAFLMLGGAGLLACRRHR